MRGAKPLTSALILFSTLILSGALPCHAGAQQNSLPALRPQMLPGAASAPAGLKALGRLPAQQRLNLAITLRLRHQEELKGLLRDIYNPSSAHYQHYLSVEEFTEQFGPTAEEHERVLAFARSNGLTVTHISANRLVVDVNGAAQDIERTFGVRMHLYRHPVERRAFYAPDVEPSLDPSLPIQGVAGLSTLNLPHPASPQPVLSALPQDQPGGSGLDGAFTASDLRAAYIPGVALTGAGQSVGLFEMSGYRISDIQAYFSAQSGSLSVPVLNVLVDGVDGTCGTSCDDGEQALDIEMALALAPGLSAVIVYEGDTPADILNQMAADNLSKQLSCSYVFVPDPALYEPIFLEFAAQGQSFFASSGDGGAYSPPDCASNCWTSRFPADDPYVTAVGGTLLSTNGAGGAWSSESAWPLSGGGINSYGYPIPSYQAPLINALNQGSPALRNIPDVAAAASNIFVEANGGAGASGGTSASAPLWASFTALVNQQAGGAPVGFLNPLVYPLALTADYASDFHDITSGTNSNSYSPDLFSAVAGYDLATGLGSPNGQGLIDALAPANTGANFTLLASSPTLVVEQGAQATAQISLQAVNGFNGTVNLGYVVVGQPTGIIASLGPSSLSGAAASTLTVSTSTATSTPTAMVAITGTSGGLTQSIYIPVTVLLPNLVETAVSAPPASVAPGATFSVTDTVQNSGQAAAGSSATGYYLSDTTSKNALAFPVGSRTVPALAAAATSSATVTVTVPGGIWPNTPYYLLACANDTNAVAEATTGNCLASSTTTLYNLAKTATTTALTLTSSGAPAASVASGALVTLTASVLAGSTPVTPGQVNFCDSTAAHCTDIHLLGTAQLTAGGTATLSFIPGIGNHLYQAIFAGTNGYAASTSVNASLQVTGTHPTTTTVAESGSAGDYSLSSTVTGVGGLVSPSGTLSFLDTSNSNALLGGVTLTAGAPSLGWLASPSPSTGADPQGVAAADFNGDGIPDLAVANRNDFTVSIFLGNGDGTFKPLAAIPDIYSAQAIAVADFNGDGIADLAVTNSGWNSVTILLGKGDGTFTAPVSELSTGVLPAALTVADLNGDGIPDLAVANYGDTVLSVFLGIGDGTFTTAPVVQLLGTAQGVAAGDFNRDGRMDLAVAVAGPGTEMVEVLLGNGDGTFTPSASTLSVGSYPSAVVAADFDGDGIPDLAVTIAFSDSLAVFLGNGDGTFRPAAASPETGGYPLSILAADFNGDGVPDLAVGNDGGSTLTILLGQGDGTFTAAGTGVPTGNSPISIAAADFNGDGFPDLVTANLLDDTASVFLTQMAWTATATLNGVNPSGAGSHLVDASYAGDANYSAGVSTTVTLLTGPIVGWPTPPTFPSESVGATSPAQSVTVTNTGGANLAFTAIGVTGPFTISPTGTTCSTANPVAASGTCTVAITFTPTGAVAAGGSLLLTDNAPGSPQTLNWTANGLNPAPGIVSLAPASATAGAAAETLTLTGTNFVSTSTVTYNGVAHTATFVSGAQLKITLTTGDQATAGTYAVVVTNPSPGGGASKSVKFTVDNPKPGITSFSPASLTAGAVAQTLTISGTSFVSGAAVTYNSLSHAATVASATQLTIPLTTADLAAAGSYPVIVTNPAPSLGASTAVNFPVNNPVPAITSLSPATVTAGAGAQVVTITGANFLTTSAVTYNSVAHSATYVSAAQLKITLTAGDQATAGSYPVVITNPSPGGGASSSVAFTVSGPSSIGIKSTSPGSVTLDQGGGSQAVAVSLTRTNFTGSVTLATSTLPTGVTATYTQPGTGTSGSIALAAASSATLVANKTITITASGTGVGSVTGTFTLTVTGPIAVTLTPASPSVALGATQVFTATLTGATSNAALNWYVNGVLKGNSAQGTLTACTAAAPLTCKYTAPPVDVPSPNPVVIGVASAADASRSKTASVTVTDGIAVTLNPTSKSLALGATQVFTATIAGTTNTALNWYVNGVPGGSSLQGTLGACSTAAPWTCTYTAPSVDVPSPNPAVIKVASAADPSKSMSANVTVTDSIAVTLTPASAKVALGGTQLFTATISNSSGNPKLNWYVNGVLKGNSAEGTLTACTSAAPFKCTYTAPASALPSPNPAVVKVASAADAAKSMSASVTVTAP